MKKLKYIAFLVIGLSFILACGKDEPVVDRDVPVITLMSPSAAMYMAGDTVYIHAEASDNDELHEIGAKIERTHNGSTEEVWTYDTHSHTASYSLHEMYIVEMNGAHNDFKLNITVSDHNANVATKEFSFHVM